MLAGGDEVSEVHEGNGEIVVFLGGGEGVLNMVELLIADVEVDFGAVGQFADSGLDHLFKQGRAFSNFWACSSFRACS